MVGSRLRRTGRCNLQRPLAAPRRCRTRLSRMGMLEAAQPNPTAQGQQLSRRAPGTGFSRVLLNWRLGGEGRAACRAGQLASPAPVGNDGFRPDSVRYNTYSPYGRPGGGYGGYGGYGGSPYGTPSGGGYGGPSYGPVPYGPVGQAEGGTAGTPGGVVGGTRPRPPKAADTTPWTPAAKRQQ